MNEKQTSLAGQTGTSATGGTGLATAHTANAVAEAGKTIAQDAKHVATEVVGQAKQQVASKIEDQREKAAQGLNSVAGAIRQTGEGLRDGDQLGVKPYVEGLADQVERFSDYILSSNVGQLVGEVEGFARREPAIFLGGAFLLGLVGARFLKSSGPAYESNRSLEDNSYDHIRDEPRSAYGAGSYGRGDNERVSYGGRPGQRESTRDYDDRGYRGQSQGGTERTRVASNDSHGAGSSSNGTGTSSNGTYGAGTSSSTSSSDKGMSTGGTYGSGTSTGGTYGTGTSTTGTSTSGTGTSTGGTYGTGTSTVGTYGTGTSTGGTYGSGSGAVSNAGTGTSTATSTAGVGTSASPGGTYGAGSTTGSSATSTTGTGLDADLKSGTTLPGTGKTTTEAAGTSAAKPSESTGKR